MTSVDPVTLTILAVGAAVAIPAAMPKPAPPKIPAPHEATAGTASPATPNLSEAAKTNKKMAASMLTKDWNAAPTLSKPALLGLGAVQ